MLLIFLLVLLEILLSMNMDPMSFRWEWLKFLILTPMLSRLLISLLCLNTVLFLFSYFSNYRMFYFSSSSCFSFKIEFRRLSQARLSICRMLSVTTWLTVDFLRLFSRFHWLLLYCCCFMALSGFLWTQVHFFFDASSSKRVGSFSESCFMNCICSSFNP